MLSVSNVVGAVSRRQSNFVGNNVNENNKEEQMKAVAFVLTVTLITLVLILLVSKWLWNSCVVELVPVKKCSSVWHLVGMSVLFSLLFSNVQMPPQ